MVEKSNFKSRASRVISAPPKEAFDRLCSGLSAKRFFLRNLFPRGV